MKSEAQKISILLGLFDWENTSLNRFHCLLLLRRARGEPVPSWDDFKVGK